MIQWDRKNLFKKLRQLLNGFSLGVNRAGAYFRFNKKVKYFAMIAGAPLLLFVVILITVLIEAPDKKLLKSFRSAVPSEVYTADGVLIGRFSVQERKPVKYEEISRPVID